MLCLFYALIIHVVLAVFNMLPLPPLDVVAVSNRHLERLPVIIDTESHAGNRRDV
jgi:Zn-dependent protease